MTLRDLFRYIEQLNKIYKELGSTKEFGLKFNGLKSYENLDCFHKQYTNFKEFEKAMTEESYYTDIGSCEVVKYVEDYELDNLEYKVHFKGVTNGTREIVEQDCYIYIFSSLKEDF